jgi:large subunit ribosomal protein L25
MVEAITVDAEPREDFGKNAARRIRSAGRIPGIVYGGGGPAIPVAVDPTKIQRILHSESGHNAIFTLEVRGKAPSRVMIRDWQSEPVHGGLLHVDLVRIARDTKLRVSVPIHITGEAQGVKVQSGIFEFILREVELECLPDDIPDHITVDVTELTIGRNLRVSELPVGPNVKVITEPHRVVAHVVALRAEEEKPAEVVEVAAATPAEPELIRKRKPEGEGEEEAEAAEEKKEEKKEGKKEGKREGKREG